MKYAELSKSEILSKIKDGTIPVEDGISLLKFKKGIDGKNIKKTDIAVVGISSRVPGADDIGEFWTNLINGVDSIKETPKERWNMNESVIENANSKERPICKWSGLLNDYDKFDPLFFNISPLEAELMDPQQRLFLEESWKAIEDAGINPESLSGSNCGVFVGVAQGDYSQNLRHSKDRLDAQSLNGGQNSILSARISYFLNLVGPNVAVDTACSSSLVATHMAYQSIVNGECEMALAGGVNILSTADMNLMTSNGKMLSKDGRCKAFDEDADGFVLSEAVAVVVLMPLDKALNENHSIYGVIKGSNMNQDGRSNGITAPSAKSQTKLILDLYKKYDINPAKISYVEAHGTGTKLGDPIETSALTNAFWECANPMNLDSMNSMNYCAIGSSKTNIGHSLTVSGVIGLIKVLLCMKYKKLVPSLHFNHLNQHIHLEKSPFYVNTEYKDWETESGEERLAAISSFGLSGTNCHMVIGEGPKVAKILRDEQKEYLFTMSAKTKDSLEKMIERFVDWLKRQENQPSLKDISYTLNTGRAHFDYRVAVISNSKEELIRQFSEYLRNNNYFDEIILREKEFVNKEITGEKLNELFRNKQDVRTSEKNKVKLEEVKKLYLDGTTIPWNLLYERGECRRISLPTYAFSKEHYWVSEIDAVKGDSIELASLHPLITSNQSTLQDTKFQFVLTGNESVLNDHRINGQKVLPGAAYIEMVRAAATIAGENRVCGIRDITWLKPIIPQEYPVDVIISLSEKNNEVEFDVYTYGKEREKIIHAMGKVMYEGDIKDRSVVIDLEQVKSRCCEEVVNVESYYNLFESALVSYGDSFHTLKKVWSTDGEVLAKLELMEKYHKEAEGYVMYPGLLDGALQSAIALGSLINEENGTCSIPFKIENISIYDTIPALCYAYGKFSDDCDKDSNIKKYDISILDTKGTTIVELKGVLSRPFNKENETQHSDIVAFKGVWKESKLKESMIVKNDILLFDTDRELYLHLKKTMAPNTNCYLVLLGKAFHEIDDQIYEINPNEEGDYIALRDSLFKKNIKSFKVINLWCYRKDYTTLDTPVESGLTHMFYFTKAFMHHSYSNKVKVSNIALRSEDESCAKWNGINGYGKSVNLELPNVFIKTIMVDLDTNVNLVIENEINLEDDGVFDVCYVKNQCMTKVMEEVEIKKLDYSSKAIKENSVYIISGGAGGLGLLFAEYISSKVKAIIILLGRSELSKEKQYRIKQIESGGSTVRYFQVDITNMDKLSGILNEVRNEYGKINGIIHSAGVIKDALFIRKTEDMMQCVIEPKVKGVINLDELTKRDALEFFVSFSAIASVFGNVGQCDYSYANSFLDYYMEERKSLVEQGKRKGISSSINWPLWEQGGMNISDDTKRKLFQRLGMSTLSPSNGFQFFEYVLNTQGGQFMVISGKKDAIIKAVNNINQNQIANHLIKNESAEIDFLEFRSRTEKYFSEIISEVIKLPIEKIKPEVDFEQYGIDSLIIININEKLEDIFGPLSSTLLFEYSNLRKLCAYFMDRYKDKLIEIFGDEMSYNHNFQEKEEVITDIPEKKESNDISKSKDCDIAIIGLSGKYPMANDLEEFWTNLEEGKDCIEEIPIERWDYKEYYNPDKNHSGTTYSKWGGFIKDVDQFDPLFFNISPKEAELMDPQERLFLETVWNCIEGAGYHKNRLSEQEVGVFVGVMYGGYQLYGEDECNKGNRVALNSSFASIANRISYYFDLHGSSLAVDTMCSSSLTALHLACESIQRGDNQMALVGGVNLILHPNKYLLLSQGKFMSTDGKCRTFGADGDGYVPGEGVGAILLKPLSEAEKDQDYIYAVIKGTALNHGGKTNGYTVPNPNAQEKVIEKALKKTGIDPRTINYVEAHGTGTSLGDPIEITGLSKAYEKYTDKTQFCSIGSVKSNIGHSESAAGIAALTKVVLQMTHKALVPSIHSDRLNPKINFTESPFYVQHKLEEWNQPNIMIDGKYVKYPRRAAVSSFGAGGSNAHIILEEYNKKNSRPEGINRNEPVLIILSAKNEQRLKLYVKDIIDWLDKNQVDKKDCEYCLYDIAYTLMVGREEMEERIAFAVNSIDELRQTLDAYYSAMTSDIEIYKGNTKRSQFRTTLFERRAGQEFLRTVIDDKEVLQIAELWVQGIEFEWNSLYKGIHPNIIILPTHPFIRKRYWVGSYQHEETAESINEEIPIIKENNNRYLTSSQVPLEWLDKIKERMELWEVKSQSYQGDEVSLDIIEDSIAIVTLNDRENSNTFSDQLVSGLISRFNEINNNQKIKTVVLTGYESVFCMGGTREQLFDISDQKNKFTDTPFMFLGLLQCKVPVISAIQGHASGGGLLFGLYGDIIVMAEEGMYSAVFTKYGFTPGMGATFILKEKFGNNLATEMMYTAKSFRGEELKERGASIIVRSQQEVLNTAINIAKMLVDKPVQTLRVLKKELVSRITDQLLQCIYREEKMHEETFTQPIVKEKINRYYKTSPKISTKTSPKINLQINPQINHHNQEDSIITLKEVKENNSAISEPIVDGVNKIIKEILHINAEEINPEMSFKDLGVDSISGLEIVRGLNKKYKLELDSVIIYDYPTIIELVKHIEGILGNKEFYKAERNINPSNNGVWGITKKKTQPVHAIQDRVSIQDNVPIQESVLIQDSVPIQKEIMNIVGRILHIPIEEVSLDSQFKELGVDSISGVEIVRDINKKYGIELDTIIIYDYTTIEELAEYIGNNFSIKFNTTTSCQTLENYKMDTTYPISHGVNKEAKDEPARKKVGLKIKENVAEHRNAKVTENIGNPEKVSNNSDQDGIAVIGMSGRFPGAKNLDEFWDNLCNGVCSIEKIPKERWDNDEYYEPDMTAPNKSYSNCGGFLTDIDEFDPLFFNISPLEAEYMDPQQRIFLEESWIALENAGYSNKLLSNLKCGVFVGATQGDYIKKLGEVEEDNTAEAFAGVSSSILASRISYFLNLKGPSLSLDTACSSSLIAIHQACQSILSGECDMALAGGVKIMLTPDLMIQTSKMQMLSKSGTCRPFDQEADGTILGEGAGVVVLKPIKQAIKDGDYIYGVIKSSGMNQDGRTNGITAPSALSQKNLEIEVYKKGNINPKDITFIEAHGTGTSLGDPIEVKALTEAFREYTDKVQFCGLGSVKSNIGHTTMSAGVASFIKVLLCLQHKKIVPTVNYNSPNSRINFEDSPFYVANQLQDWIVANKKKRMGAVSAFGMSGTNCHIVIEEAPEVES